jgi:hypothetical protein
MREEWYADKRDILKWSGMTYVARLTRASVILQVLFYRKSEPGVFQVHDGEETREEPVPVEVWSHFRDVHTIRRLPIDNVAIECFAEPWSRKLHHGTEYFEKLSTRIRALPKPAVVLLDPDTGLAPKAAKLEHVTKKETTATYQALEPGDTLAIYQHKPRKPQWHDAARKAFADSLGAQVTKGRMPIVISGSFAADVILLAVIKT